MLEKAWVLSVMINHVPIVLTYSRTPSCSVFMVKFTFNVASLLLFIKVELVFNFVKFLF